MRRVRRAAACAVALVLVALSATPAAGQDDRAPAAGNAVAAGSVAAVGNQAVTAGRPSQDDGETATRDLPSGAQAGLASALYPGLGQLLNKKEHKAAIIGGAGSFLIAKLILEDRRTRNSFRLYQETGDGKYFDQYSRHFDARQNILWWAILVGIYGIADAYVDAHLAGFDEPLSPRIEGSLAGAGVGGPDGFRLAVVVRF